MRIIPYIKFLWNSTNAHGIHSPFVFKLATQCFYANQKQELLQRLLQYFKPEHVYISGPDISRNSSNQHATVIDYPQQETGFAIINHKGKATTLNNFEQLLPFTSNNTVVILNNIHASPDMEEAWKTIKTNPQVTVTIDIFTYGLVFFRKEQSKEHFIIRPYTSFPLDIALGAKKLWGLIN